MIRRAAQFAPALLALAGCGGRIEAGLDPRGGYDDEGAWQEPGEGRGLRVPRSFDVWIGAVELQVSNMPEAPASDPWAPFGPERMTLVLGLDAAGDPIGGSVTFGERAAPPPVTDPDGWYPPDFRPPYLVPRIWAGFEYPARTIIAEGDRLLFSIAPGDVFRPWCELQRSRAVSDPPGFACSAGPPDPGSGAPPSAPRLAMCQGPQPACRCDEAGCSADTTFRLGLELEIDGGRAAGRVLGRAGLWDLSLTLVDSVAVAPGE
ncbi:MAG: hypothetical protein FJ104_15180 [Deltaproteobacteria bacterium]|nr:hypothetical protein [Deltaproteobacteria bacterium]